MVGHHLVSASGTPANPTALLIFVTSSDGDNGKTLLGIVDYSWLFSYAVAMYFR